MSIRSKKLLYHLSKLSNLNSIIEYGLLSRKRLYDCNICFQDVADPNIMDKRKLLGLDNYVPFHFHPHSSFDVAVKNKYQDEEFIYLCIHRDFAKTNHFKILPVHPLSTTSSIMDNGLKICLYDYSEGFEKIDWEAMESSSTLSEYHKSVRMAECLTNLDLKVDCFQSIGVRNNDVKRKVIEIFSNHGIYNMPRVDVRPWFDR